MKIYPFKEFVLLPEGTIYSHPEESYLGVFRKGKTLYHDSEAIDFYEAVICAMPEHGVGPLRVDNIESRWALYDQNAQFAVYDPADIQTMVKMLTQ